VLCCELDEPFGGHREHPLAVKDDLRPDRVKNLEDLLLVGLGVLSDLFLVRCFRVSDLPRGIADIPVKSPMRKMTS